MNKRIKPIHIESKVTMEARKKSAGTLMEILLLFIGLLGYLFCNTTALDMDIPIPLVLIIGAVAFGLMILIAWYKRVFFGIFGGVAAVSLLAWKVTFPFFGSLGRALEVCYNYTIHLLASQPNYSDYKDYMTMDITDILKTPMVLQRYFYTALILLSLIAALFFALALFRRLPPIIAFLVPAAGLVPFFFYGIVPHYIAFSIFLSAVVGCYGQSLIRQKAAGEKKNKVKKEKGVKKAKKVKPPKKKYTAAERLAFASQSGNFGVVVTAVMLVITIGTASVIYTRPIVQMEQVRKSIDMLAEDAMNVVFGETYEKNLNVAGYLEDDEPLSLEVPRWRRLNVAKVYTTTDLPLYLRYRTTVSISEDGWHVADESFNEQLSSRLEEDFTEYTQFYEYLKLTAPSGDPQTAELDAVDSEVEGYVRDEITIQPQYRASDLLGIPGGAMKAQPGGKYTDLEQVADTYLRYEKKPYDRTYSFDIVSPLYTSDVFLGKFQKTQNTYLQTRAKNSDRDFYLNNELVYSGLVKNYYTTLPAKLRELTWSKAWEITKNYDKTIEKVQAVERYFRENYTYSAERRRLSHEDGTLANAYEQIDYFLFQNEDKNGYCTLFASSMAVMLRSLGIPARVVTGYYAEPQLQDVEEYSVQLQDNNYHAWVEVYFDGIGWMPFEPTPDFGVERNYYLLDLADQGLESEYADDDVEIEYEEIEGIVIYDVIPDPVPHESKPQNPNNSPFPMLNQKNGWVVLALEIMLILLAVAIALFGVYVAHRKHLKKMRMLPPTEGVRAGYNIILRLMQMRGFKFFEGELPESFAQRADNLELAPLPLKPVMPILQKALYGTEPISEEERAMVADYAEALDQKLFRKIDPIRGIWFSLILSKKPSYKSMIWKFK